jgi:hypothetical protein
MTATFHILSNLTLMTIKSLRKFVSVTSKIIYEPSLHILIEYNNNNNNNNNNNK